MRKKILAIDDDGEILLAFTLLLQSEGYVVETSSYIDRAILQKKTLPDLILLDVFLGGVDGRVVCKQFKRQSLTKHIPIIMLSAAINVEKTVRDAQADDFLAKPFDSKDLINKVKKYIGDPN